MGKVFISFVLVILFAAFAHCNDVDDGIVCGYDGVTYPSADACHKAGTKILHCGPCGGCSTLQDIQIYYETRNNLTEVSRGCALLLVDGLVRKCLNEKIGFTEKCTECWMENIKCDKKHCFFVCLKSTILNEPYVDEDGNLNKCLQCDETTCGPDFMACAGANRRRSCIHSDIQRNEKDVCTICEHEFVF